MCWSRESHLLAVMFAGAAAQISGAEHYWRTAVDLAAPSFLGKRRRFYRRGFCLQRFVYRGPKY